MAEKKDKSDISAENTPLRIADAASMLRKVINPNERPYTKDILKYNNQIVDSWYSEVLQKICNKNACIRAGQFYSEWQYFYTGKTIKTFIYNLNSGFIFRPSPEVIDHWVKIFTEQSVKQLARLGALCVSHGWKLIMDETLIRDNLNKWEKIYSLSDDPLEWRKLANNYPKLWNMTCESPFWSQEDSENINQKVMTILKTPISPSQ